MLRKFKLLNLKRLLGLDKKLKPSDVAQLCKSNSMEAYDSFWSDEELVKAYIEPARVESYMYVVRYVLSKSYGNKVIDIGFGSGDFLRLLVENANERNFEIHGIDYSESAVQRASKLIPSGHFRTGDVYTLPYASDSFDQVFCIQTLEHLKDAESVLMEMDRVCKPDGMILISIPNGELDTYEGHVNFWNQSDFKGLIAPREVMDFFVYNQERVFMVSMKPLKV